MGYVFRVTKDRPTAMYSLAGSSPYADSSGYNRIGRIKSGMASPAKAAPVCSNRTQSSLFGPLSVAEFFPDVYIQGREKNAFTLEAWVFPIQPEAGRTAILSKPGQFDGLSINKNTLIFSTKYTTAGEAKVQYVLDPLQKAYVVGVHNSQQNKLYVNGELVGAVDLTDAQLADTYASSNSTLVTGETQTTDTTLACNCFAFYNYELPLDAIQDHYSWGVRNTPFVDTYAPFGGVRVKTDIDSAHVYLETTWDTDEDWSTGYLSNVSYRNDQLVPEYDIDGVIVPGNWVDSFVTDFDDITSIYSVRLDWDGEGMIVEVSSNGDSWHPVDKRKNVPMFDMGDDPTGQDMLIRVTFKDVGGYLNSITATGFADGTFDTGMDRTASLNGFNQINDDLDGFDYDENNNLYLTRANSVLTIGAGSAVRTLMFFIKRETVLPTISFTGTNYGNGSTSVGIPPWQWILKHIVAGSDVTGPITMQVKGALADIVVFPTALSASDISKIAQGVFGVVVNQWPDITAFTVSSLDSVQIVSHEWSIAAAG